MLESAKLIDLYFLLETVCHLFYGTLFSPHREQSVVCLISFRSLAFANLQCKETDPTYLPESSMNLFEDYFIWELCLLFFDYTTNHSWYFDKLKTKKKEYAQDNNTVVIN